jgi:RHS repeat-associated protein
MLRLVTLRGAAKTRMLGTGAIAALIAGLLLVSSTAAASYPKTRVGVFFEDPAGFVDGEHDLSVETSSEKSSSVGPESVGRNLFYNRFRYYDPKVGRYISPDPIGLVGGANVYGYGPNTTVWGDPFGLEGGKTKCEGLPDDLAGTFLGGRYATITLQKDLIVYRAGTKSRPLGQFFSKTAPTSVIQARIDKAILPVWPGGAKSPIDTVFKVKIPKGTVVHIGKVGPQGGFYVGGTQQVVVQKPWNIEGVEVLDSWAIS